jgi:hypothetical protein
MDEATAGSAEVAPPPTAACPGDRQVADTPTRGVIDGVRHRRRGADDPDCVRPLRRSTTSSLR